MNEIQLTYDDLFALLRSLGFQQRRDKDGLQCRVFFHEPTDTILAFARPSDEHITAADMLSTEVHLQAKGIVDRPLESLLSASPAKSK